MLIMSVQSFEIIALKLWERWIYKRIRGATNGQTDGQTDGHGQTERPLLSPRGQKKIH